MELDSVSLLGTETNTKDIISYAWSKHGNNSFVAWSNSFKDLEITFLIDTTVTLISILGLNSPDVDSLKLRITLLVRNCS